MKYRKQVNLLFAEAKPSELTSQKFCADIKNFLEHEMILDPDANLPLLYLACGQFYNQANQPNDALEIYKTFLIQYPDHVLASNAKAGLLGNSKACEERNNLQNTALANLEDLMSSLYYICGRAYQDNSDYANSIQSFEAILQYYPSHALAPNAKQALDQVKLEMEEVESAIRQAIRTRTDRILASIGISFIPGIGDVKDVLDFIFGVDLVTGEPLTTFERVVVVIATIAGAGSSPKYADELHLLAKYHDELIALGRVDEARDLLRYSDEFTELLTRHGDDLMTLAKYSDEVTQFLARRGIKVSSRLPRCSKEAAELLARHGDEASMLRYFGDCSFSANTLVTTDHGPVPISDIKAGDQVQAYNEITQDIDYYPVIATWSNEDPFIVYLTIDDELLETTPEHLFYVGDEEWIEAGALQEGDEVVQPDGSIGTVKSIVIMYHPQQMYNFTVDQAHTYFVGNRGWLVHNECPSADWAKKYAESNKAIDVKDFIGISDGWSSNAAKGAAWEKWVTTNVLQEDQTKIRLLGLENNRWIDHYDGARKILWEFKYYRDTTNLSPHAIGQLEDYVKYAKANDFTLNYVFARPPSDDILKNLGEIKSVGGKIYIIEGGSLKEVEVLLP